MGQDAVFRQVRHPDLWSYVAHLTGRPGKRASELPDTITGLSGEERLQHILDEGCINAYPTFFAPSAVVCFTESTPAGLGYFFEVGYEPWGIVFSKQRVYDAGGGPVFHVRADEWANTRDWPEPMRSQGGAPRTGSVGVARGARVADARRWRRPIRLSF